MLRLKKDLDIAKFLKQVDVCSSDVSICTQEGDCLNLKSMLCRLVVESESFCEELVEGALLECENEEEYSLFKDFVTE